jgi:hypothetical protein
MDEMRTVRSASQPATTRSPAEATLTPRTALVASVRAGPNGAPTA